MVDRGFGIEIEDTYGEIINKDAFDLDWWDDEADSVDFKLNDEPVTRSGTSRMNKRARAGVMQPTGSTSSDADLQRLIWYMFGTLDNYKFTAKSGSAKANKHEFWGGEGKELPSFRGIAVYDMLKKYLYGLIIDQLSFEASNENVSIGAEWIYKTEKAGIIGENGETFVKPDALNDDLFLMFYDLSVTLNNKSLTNPSSDDNYGIANDFSFEINNNHDQDKTIGLGSRAPQRRAFAVNREISASVTTTLTRDTVRSILDAQYGEVGALQPSNCKILKVPLQLDIALCEDATTKATILFPECTLLCEYDMSGADAIEVTLNLATLGSGTAKLADNTTVNTDIYVKIESAQTKLQAKGA